MATRDETSLWKAPLVDWVTIKSDRILRTQRERQLECLRVVELCFGGARYAFKDVSPNNTQVIMDDAGSNFRIGANSSYLYLQIKGKFFTMYPKDAFVVFYSLFEKLFFENHQLSRAGSGFDFGGLSYMEKAEVFTSNPDIMSNWCVVRMDIKKDYPHKKMEDFLPLYIKEDAGCDYEFFFKAKYEPQYSSNGIFTGWYLRTSNYEFCAYRKDLENKSQKNKEKANIYNEYYRANGGPISRGELRLRKAKGCKDVNEILRGSFLARCFVPEQDFCREVLKKFVRNHQVRIKNDKDKNKSRWLPEPRWNNFFTGKTEGDSREFYPEKTPVIKRNVEKDAIKYFKIAYKKLLRAGCSVSKIDKISRVALKQSEKIINDEVIGEKLIAKEVEKIASKRKLVEQIFVVGEADD